MRMRGVAGQRWTMGVDSRTSAAFASSSFAMRLAQSHLLPLSHSIGAGISPDDAVDARVDEADDEHGEEEGTRGAESANQGASYKEAKTQSGVWT